MPKSRLKPLQLRLCDCRVCLADPNGSIDPVSKQPVVGHYVTNRLFQQHQFTESQRGKIDEDEIATETLLRAFAPDYDFSSPTVSDNIQTSYPETPPKNRKARREGSRNSKWKNKTQDEDSAACLQFFQQAVQTTIQGFSPPDYLTFTMGPVIQYHPPVRENPNDYLHLCSGPFALDHAAAENQRIISYFDQLVELHSDVQLTPAPPERDPFNADLRGRLLAKINVELRKLEAMRGEEWERQRSETQARIWPKDHDMVVAARYYGCLSGWEPSKLVVFFVTLVMHCLCGVSQSKANFLLSGFRESHRILLKTRKDVLDREDNLIIDSIPKDIRTVLTAFQPLIEPVTTAWVCCPKCFKLHTNEDTAKRICDHKEFEDAEECGALLYRTRRIRGKERLHPVRRYLHQPLGHWLARLLSRPGMEKLMDGILPLNIHEDLEECADIWDAPAFRNFRGPDDKPFFHRTGPEARLMFGLCFDGFNPHRVMAAGKRGSVGAIYMVCFNLPPHLRFRLENMYLVGITPGPHEPSRHQINHLLEPIVSELKLYWKPGVVISKTPSCPQGRRILAALGPVISDSPAARQLVGFAPPSHRHLCPYCWLQKKDKENLDYKNWPLRTFAEYEAHARQWKGAPDESAREECYQKHGVRWTALLDLDYWDPIKFTLIDPMHALLLNALRHHCREIWGMDVNIEEDDGTTFQQATVAPGPLTTNEISFADECILAGKKSLATLRPAVLKQLCADRELRYAGTKEELVARLKKWQQSVGILDQDGNPTPKTRMAMKAAASQPSPAAMALAHETLFEGTDASVKKIKLTVLRQLCVDHQIALPHKAKKLQTVTKILEWRKEQGYGPAPRAGKAKVVLGSTILQELWRDIESSDSPTWLGRATRLGEGAHGKLSADQWRTACTIDLVFTLIKLWATPDAGQDKSRFKDMLGNFMDLVNATKLALRRKMSKNIAEKYQFLMHRYIKGMIQLYPGSKLQPTHHGLLHLGTMLTQFGPTHAWRMFAFERFNRIIQDGNTNGRWGEMESTMMLATCRGVNLRAVLFSETAPPALQALGQDFEATFQGDNRGSLLSDMASFTPTVSLLTTTRPKALDDLDPTLRSILLRKFGQNYTTRWPHSLQTIRIGGVGYNTFSSSSKNCYIIYRFNVDNQYQLTAGRTLHILAYPPLHDGKKPECFLVVQRYTPLSREHIPSDPFRRFDGGGQLYYDTFESKLDVIRAEWVDCHFRRGVYDYAEIGACIHALPLDR